MLLTTLVLRTVIRLLLEWLQAGLHGLRLVFLHCLNRLAQAASTDTGNNQNKNDKNLFDDTETDGGRSGGQEARVGVGSAEDQRCDGVDEADAVER